MDQIRRGRLCGRTFVDAPQLNDLCTQSGILVEVNANSLDLLTDYAVRVRYPDDSVTHEDVRQAIATAMSVRLFARRYFGVE